MRFDLRQLALVALLAGSPGLAFAADDWQVLVAEALGKTGAAAPGGIYRVGLPRTDLKATLDGVELKPGFALGGWLAFEKMGEEGMVIGDLVLTMDEVNPVMTKLAAPGSRSRPCTITCCAISLSRCTCMCSATAIR